MADITLVRNTMTTLTVKLTRLQSDYNGNPRTCRWYVGSEFQGSMSLENQISSSYNFVIGDLSAGTSYQVKAIVTASGWAEDTTIGPVSLRTRNPFRWSSSARNAFNNGGSTTNLTASEWNDLVNLIEDLKPSWDGSSAKGTSGGPIRASMFNKVASAVGSPDRVNPGDPCLGSYFTDLVGYINRI